MVDADFPELVDDDRSVLHRRVNEKPIEERGLAAAQKTGQYHERQRDGLQLVHGAILAQAQGLTRDLQHLAPDATITDCDRNSI